MNSNHRLIKGMQRLFTFLLSFVIVIAGFIPGKTVVWAENTTGFQFNKLIVKDSSTGVQVADLLNGDIPELKTGVIYSLDVEYTVPSSLQFSNTYFHLNLGNGAYITTLPGSTFTEGPITATGFEELVKTPTGTGTSPYGYPTAGSAQARNGELIYKTKTSLTNVASAGEISFSIDSAYLNQDPNQILTNLIQVSLSTDATPTVDARSFNAKSTEELRYDFWTNQSSETISKGDTTSSLAVSITGGVSLTEANSKTTVEIEYPSDIEFVSLEETQLYHRNGTVISTTESGGIKTTKLEWDEPGSYSGTPKFVPHVKVPSNSTRANGSSFNIVLKNFKKTIWNDTPNVGRTSSNVSTMVVKMIDGVDPEQVTSHALIDTAVNWAFKKYDTYNVRLGSLLIKNELAIPTKPKTIEMTIDETDTAIIRGVTIPYHTDMTYGNIYWTSASGASGVASPSILRKSDVSALITNTALGLDIDDSIKSIKVDLGPIPAKYDGVRLQSDLLDTWNPNNKFISDGEYYGWSYIPNGVYGSWKVGTNADVKTTVKFYTTGTTPTAGDTYHLTGKSKAPEVKNGVGTIDKTQILGGDSFKVSGYIDDTNWDWNPLQEPEIYVIMPEGFTYSNLQVTEGTLSAPTYVGEFEKDGDKIKVWKYSIDIGQETRGQYQPNFTNKNMKVTFDVRADKTVKVATYHINDFLGITTKDFDAIGAVIKPEKWDRSNWNTDKYTTVFGTTVNSGKTMVSLSESTGVKVNQAAEVNAHSSLIDKDTGAELIYDNTSATTKENTTVVLGKGDTTTMRIKLRNNSGQPINYANVFIPLLNENLDFGPSFMPKGTTQLPLKLESVEATPNFEVKYIKLRPGKTYALNHAPQPSDYDIVTNPADANMVMLVARTTVSDGDGGRIEVTYKAENDLSMSYNNKVDVITPVLDYDINGNRSTLTLEPAAITYHSSSVKVTKEWKNYDGTTLTAPVNEVEVELYRDGTVVEKKRITADNNWEVFFDNIEMLNPATGTNYQYTVKEVGVDSSNKIQIDNSWYSTTVIGNVDQGFTVTNKKSLEATPLIPATTTKTIKKEWTNLSQAEIDSLSTTIALYKNGNKLQEMTVDKNNQFTATFSNLPETDTITSAANVYTVKELDGNGNSVEEGDTITIDGRDFTVHYDGTKIINTYVPRPVVVDPPVKKIVEGNPTNASTFHFEMKAVNPTNPMPDGSVNGVKQSTVIGSGEVEFGAFEITQAGTYQYLICEINDGIENYIYDTTIYTITFDVRDVAGQLVADKRVEKEDGTVVDEVVFTNVYKAPATTTKTITKEWANLTQAEIDTLSTTIALYKNGNKVQEATVDKNNHFTATFFNLPVTDAITSTANVYTVKELDGDGNAVEEGNSITIDSRDFTVHYDGTKIVNTYIPKPVLVDPPVKKIVEGNPTNASTFHFEMKAINPTDPMPVGSINGVKQATVIGSGEVEFGSFEITQAGTYQYVIREINDSIANYTYDTTLYTITFDVRDVAGQLVADTHVEKADGTVTNEAVFTNVYKAPASTPKTGDNSHLPIYIGAIIIALVGFGFAFIKRIRSNKQS